MSTNLTKYEGKEDSSQTSAATGLGIWVVLSLTNSLTKSGTHETFSNFFSSFELLEELHRLGIFATGTVTSNRKELLAKQKTSMEKGDYKWRTSQHTAYIQWMDSKLVHVLTTAFDPEDYGEVRRMQSSGTAITVRCPSAVSEYTKRMGGVDSFDQKRGCYSVSHRSRRWWLRIFFLLLGCSNCWRIHFVCFSSSRINHQHVGVSHKIISWIVVELFFTSQAIVPWRRIIYQTYEQSQVNFQEECWSTERNQNPGSWCALSSADGSIPSLSPVQFKNPKQTVSNNVQLMWCCTVHITVFCCVSQVMLA